MPSFRPRRYFCPTHSARRLRGLTTGSCGASRGRPNSSRNVLIHANFPNGTSSATISYVRGAGSSAAAAARGPRIPPGRTAMAMMMNTTTPMFHIAPSSKRSTISNANAAAVAAHTPRSSGPRTRPSIPCLSTRLRMKATIPPPPVAVNDPSPHSTLGGARYRRPQPFGPARDTGPGADRRVRDRR